MNKKNSDPLSDFAKMLASDHSSQAPTACTPNPSQLSGSSIQLNSLIGLASATTESLNYEFEKTTV